MRYSFGINKHPWMLPSKPIIAFNFLLLKYASDILVNIDSGNDLPSACLSTSHHPNQRWLIICYQINVHDFCCQSTKFFFEKNAFRIVFRQMAAILIRPQWVSAHIFVTSLIHNVMLKHMVLFDISFPFPNSTVKPIKLLLSVHWACEWMGTYTVSKIEKNIYRPDVQVTFELYGHFICL